MNLIFSAPKIYYTKSIYQPVIFPDVSPIINLVSLDLLLEYHLSYIAIKKNRIFHCEIQRSHRVFNCISLLIIAPCLALLHSLAYEQVHIYLVLA